MDINKAIEQLINIINTSYKIKNKDIYYEVYYLNKVLPLGNVRVFKTKGAAQEYILFNKPCLSIKEVTPIFGMMYLDTHINTLDRTTEKLKELVKNKL